MIRIWNTYKVWILIGLAYTGFYFFKGFKGLKQIVPSCKSKKFISSVERVATWIPAMYHRLSIRFKT